MDLMCCVFDVDLLTSSQAVIASDAQGGCKAVDLPFFGRPGLFVLSGLSADSDYKLDGVWGAFWSLVASICPFSARHLDDAIRGARAN